MALHDLLYRCPLCGHDPTDPKEAGDEVICPSCGARMTWEADSGRGRKRVRVEHRFPEGAGASVQVHLLTDRIAAMGGAIPAALGPDGILRCTDEIRIRWVEREKAVRYRRSLVGFRELLGRAGSPARLELEGSLLRVRPLHATDDSAGQGGGEPWFDWDLADVQALQAMTSALQVTLSGGRVVVLAFESASARRWDDLIRAALQRTWLREGRGVITEFQPRIRAR